MLKNIIAIFAALTLSVSSAQLNCSAETQIIEKQVDVPPNMLFLGDSIAEGYGLEGFETDKYSCSSYANILRDRYAKELEGKCNENMINDAVSGDTSEQLLTHLTNGEFDQNLATSDVVVISIGGNDILEIFLDFLENDLKISFNESSASLDLGNISPLGVAQSLGDMSDNIDKALEKFDENLIKISDYINQKTDSVVIIQTLYNPIENIDQLEILENFAEKKISKLNEHIKNNASNGSQTNYIVADVAADFVGKAQKLTNISRFDIHPNTEGHKIIADRVDQTIRTQKYTYNEEIEVKPFLLRVISENKGITVAVCTAIAAIIVGIVYVLRKNKKSKGQNHENLSN